MTSFGPSRFAPRLLAATAGLALVALVVSRCNHGAPDGAPCTTPFDCSSGLCLQRSNTVMVCGHVCATSADCTGGDVCGAYDFAEPDEAGAPDPSVADTIYVCRPSLTEPCSTCGGTNCLTVGTSAQGVCSTPCSLDSDCANNLCVVPVGQCVGLCAPPCDTISECPTYFTCDTVDIGANGHGRCVPANPDSGLMPAMSADASCGVDP